MSYGKILVFTLISLVIVLAMFLVANVAGRVGGGVPSKNFQKNSPYECGFEPFEDSRVRFDIHFYIVSILFIIFDVEVSLLFPLSYNFHQLAPFSFQSVLFFLLVLAVGFIYEWLKGALDWRTMDTGPLGLGKINPQKLEIKSEG